MEAAQADKPQRAITLRTLALAVFTVPFLALSAAFAHPGSDDMMPNHSPHRSPVVLTDKTDDPRDFGDSDDQDSTITGSSFDQEDIAEQETLDNDDIAEETMLSNRQSAESEVAAPGAHQLRRSRIGLRDTWDDTPLIPVNGTSCQNDDIFVIAQNGVIYKIENGGSRAVMKMPGGRKIAANMLAIGPSNASLYVSERLGKDGHRNTIDIYHFSNGQWDPRPFRYASDLNGSLVAGATNLETGEYFFGGFERYNTGGGWPAYGSTGTGAVRFVLWKFDGNRVVKVGWVHIDSGEFPIFNRNGDIAFDSEGNLYIINGNSRLINITSVTKANLDRALSMPSGAQAIPGQTAKPIVVTGQSDTNGAGFLTDGSLLLSDQTSVNKGLPVSPGNFSHYANTYDVTDDLATCSSPATLTLKKNIQGRAHASDQFTISIDEIEVSETTAGSQNGIQDQVVGPFPVTEGTYTISESLAESSGSTNLQTSYTTSYICQAKDGTLVAQGPLNSRGQGRVPIGPEVKGKSVVCTITNSPIAPVTLNVTKKTIDNNVEHLAAGWQMNSVFTGLVPRSGFTSKTTGTNGMATWKLDFAPGSSTGSINISEMIPSGSKYAFQDLTCTRTRNSSTQTVVPTTTTNGATIANLRHGDVVDCTFRNNKAPVLGNVKLQKYDGGYDGAQTTPMANISFTLYKDSNENGQLDDTDEAVSSKSTSAQGIATWTDLPLGGYCLGEDQAPQGYDAPQAQCFTVADDNEVTKTFVNTRQTGAVSWQKVDAQNTSHYLKDSQWLLRGPDGTQRTIVDCVGGDTTCTSDSDQRAGFVKVTGLTWGTYTLTELKAPAGYQLSNDTKTFEIGPDTSLDMQVGKITNAKANVPSLPFTGGMGSDIFTILGGIVLSGAILTTLVWERRRLSTTIKI